MRKLRLHRDVLRQLRAPDLHRVHGRWIHTAYGNHTCGITNLSCGHFCTQGVGCGGSDTCTTGHD